MIKHYILNIKSQADCDWDKYVLRDPLTGEHSDLTTAIAQAVDDEDGSYLVRVKIDVEVLEKAKIAHLVTPPMRLPEKVLLPKI